jgi:DNA-binding XRE family transcriptional regulator
VRQALQHLPATRAAGGWQEARITQAELARLAGVSRQGVNGWLREAQTAGWLVAGYGRLRWCEAKR